MEKESTFNAREANRRGLKRAAIIFVENEFSRAHEKAFRKAFKGEVLETLTLPEADATYIKSIALKLKGLDFDLLYVPDAWPLSMGLLKEIHKLGLKGKTVLSVYSAQMQDVITANGAAADGLIYSYPEGLPDENAPSYFTRQCSTLLFDAIKACSGDVSCIRAKLNEMFGPRGILSTPLQLKTVIKGSFAGTFLARTP